MLRRFFILSLVFLAVACASAPTPAPPLPTSAAPAETPAAPAPPAAPLAPAVAEDPAQAPLASLLPPDPAVRIGRLDNGLTYIVRENRRPEKRADIWLAINAGSILEDEDQQGLAHFLEHMAFNGTEKFAKDQIVDYLESIGMRFGPDLNAYTAFDETVYMLRVPTDDEEIVERAFEILEQWATSISLEPEEVEKERGVVLEEWRLGRGAQARILDRELPVLLKDSRYAQRLPIGKTEIIQNAPPETLARYYRDWYRPDLMAVIAVGDFEAGEIEGRIRKYFEPIPKAEDPRPRKTFAVPGHPETLVSIVTDPEATQTTIGVSYKHPAAGNGSVGDYRRSLTEQLYNAMLNNRLDELRRGEDPPFLVAFSMDGSFARGAEIYQQLALVAEGGVERGLEALLTEVERVERHGFTTSELERARRELLRAFEQGYEERDKTDSRGLAAEYGRHFLEGEAIPGIAVELELARRFLPEIGLEELNALARRWITDQNRVISLTGPEAQADGLPDEAELLAVFDAVESKEIAAYVDEVQEGPLLAETPAPGPVVEESEIAELGITEWRLANGVRILLKPTDFQNDEVLILGYSPGGSSLVSEEHHASARFADTLMGQGGAGRFNLIALEKALAGKAVNVGAFIGEDEEGFQGNASPADMETLFQLIHLVVTEPRVDPGAVESFLSRTRSLVENRLAQPEAVFGDRFTEALSQGHPRRQPLSVELLDQVDLDRAAEIFRERFADLADLTVILVGSFEPAAVRSLVETYLGSLPAAGREEEARDVGVRYPAEVVELEVAKGLEPKSSVRISFTGPAEWSPEAAHDIGSMARVLQTRLREILREDLGGTYGVGVRGNLQREPEERYRVDLRFGCSPEKVDELVAATHAEIARLRDELVEESYTQKVRELQRRARETNLQVNGFWLQLLARYDRLDLDLERIQDYDLLVERVTPEQVRESARRYLDSSRYVQAILRPEAAGQE